MEMKCDKNVYKATDKMSEIICDNASLLLVMSRFGISLGFGDDSVHQVCSRQNVDLGTFLAVINFLSDNTNRIADYGNDLSVDALLDYLKRSHSYFLDFALPGIREKLVAAIGKQGEVTGLVLKFFDDYMAEVGKHMEYEEQLVFPFVESLLEGRADGNFAISTFSRYHIPVDEKLTELKNIIIKYIPQQSANNNLLNSVLFDIFSCEKELQSHCRIEDYLFVPAVMNLEKELGHAHK